MPSLPRWCFRKPELLPVAVGRCGSCGWVAGCSGAEVAHGLSLAALPEEKGRLKDLAVADLSSVSNRRPGVGVGRTPSRFNLI